MASEANKQEVTATTPVGSTSPTAGADGSQANTTAPLTKATPSVVAAPTLTTPQATPQVVPQVAPQVATAEPRVETLSAAPVDKAGAGLYSIDDIKSMKGIFAASAGAAAPAPMPLPAQQEVTQTPRDKPLTNAELVQQVKAEMYAEMKPAPTPMEKLKQLVGDDAEVGALLQDFIAQKESVATQEQKEPAHKFVSKNVVDKKEALGFLSNEQLNALTAKHNLSEHHRSVLGMMDITEKSYNSALEDRTYCDGLLSRAAGGKTEQRNVAKETLMPNTHLGAMEEDIYKTVEQVVPSLEDVDQRKLEQVQQDGFSLRDKILRYHRQKYHEESMKIEMDTGKVNEESFIDYMDKQVSLMMGAGQPVMAANVNNNYMPFMSIPTTRAVRDVYGTNNDGSQIALGDFLSVGNIREKANRFTNTEINEALSYAVECKEALKAESFRILSC